MQKCVWICLVTGPTQRIGFETMTKASRHRRRPQPHSVGESPQARQGALRGEIVGVTGGSQGIGRSVCVALVQAGARVAVGFHTNAQAAQAVCQEASNFDGHALAIQVDVTDPDAVERFVDQANHDLGPIDALVNCAGTWPQAPIWKMDNQAWGEALAVNLNGTYHTCKAVSRQMMARRKGKIVNFSSVAAVRGAHSGHAHYAAAKGGVISLTRSLANELGPYQINVNAVAPGVISTKMTEQALQDREAEYRAQIPLGRIGTPLEVAHVVLFLISPAAQYITGQTIHVNGGMWMG